MPVRRGVATKAERISATAASPKGGTMSSIFRAAAATILAIAITLPAHADDTSAIKAAQASWEKAFSGGDGAAASAAVFTEDARLLPPGAPMVVGREAIGKFWQGDFDAGIKDLKLGLIAVDMVGDDTMIETGTFAVTVPASDGSRKP